MSLFSSLGDCYLSQGNISYSNAYHLLTSVLNALPIKRVITADAAEAQLQVSPLETLSSPVSEGPSRLDVQSRSAPVRRLRFSMETTKAERETEGQQGTETGGDKEGQKETLVSGGPEGGNGSRLSLIKRNSNPLDVKNHALLVVQVTLSNPPAS